MVDPAWKAKLPIPAANGAHEQYAKLNTSLLADRLREIARLLGRDKPLPPVFRAVESVLPTLKEQQPLLIPRLANCLYHAIILQGQPEDMPRYRKLFGNPPDDPNFYKLQALICEHDNLPEMVHDFWKKFDEWLGTKPPGWPADLLARARSRVWIRLGENAERALKELPDADDDEMFALLRPPKKKKPKPLDPPALACFRKAVEFAPDWSVATKELFKSLEGLKQLAEAEKVAREFLEHQPENLLALTALGSMLHEQGRGREAAELYLRAVALNPLDKSLRTQAVCALQAQARNELAGRNPKGVEAVYERHRQLLDEEMPAAIAVLRAVAFLKLGQIEEADHLRQQALAIPGQRLSAAYRIMVDSQLAKLKPAEKRAADALYAGELAMRLPMPEEVSRLIACYEMYLLENTTYRGQKTHRTKILDQAVRTLTVDAPEQDFEMLANSLFWTKAWKQLKKVADAGMIRFRANPHFLLMRSEAGFATNERHYTIELRLRSAKVLAERSREPRHRALIERIDELLAEVALPFDMFNSFFGRR